MSRSGLWASRLRNRVATTPLMPSSGARRSWLVRSRAWISVLLSVLGDLVGVDRRDLGAVVLCYRLVGGFVSNLSFPRVGTDGVDVEPRRRICALLAPVSWSHAAPVAVRRPNGYISQSNG